MLVRFSLYGFLKNQRYHEPFFVLALLEQGLPFFDIGLLIGLGSILVNVFEVPFGAIADVYGRRRCLLFALLAYIVAFVLFGAAPGLLGLVAAMIFYSVGEAFRGGTHKAMIFDWLRAQGREAEAASVYGFTRSWSKRGSAVSAVVGAAIALAMGSFTAAFWWTAIPYVLNMVNLAGYPKVFDRTESEVSVRAVLRATWQGLRAAVTLVPLRRLLVESMIFEGTLRSTSSYLQPLVQVGAVALVGGLALAVSDFQATVVAAGVVYFALGVVEAIASAKTGRFSDRAGGHASGVRWLWLAHLACGVTMLVALLLGLTWLAIVAFVASFGAARNLFRGLQLARYDEQCPPELAATVLSLESQSHALFVAAAAPLIGWAIDRTTTSNADDPRALWPAVVLGVAGGAIAVILQRARRRQRSRR